MTAEWFDADALGSGHTDWVLCRFDSLERYHSMGEPLGDGLDPSTASSSWSIRKAGVMAVVVRGGVVTVEDRIEWAAPPGERLVLQPV